MTKPKIDLTVGEIINNDGCVRLIEAVYEQSIKDVLAEMKYARIHGEHRCSPDYISAVAFLKQSGKGQRILKILNNLTDEQITDLLKRQKHYEKGKDYYNE